MNTLLAKSAGFCWGVRRAVETALSAGGRVFPQAVFTDGPLIHNAHQMRLLEESGVWQSPNPATLAPGSTLLVRAHGISPERRAFLESLPLTLVDATCPDVAKIHRIIEKKAAEGATVFVYGDAGHAEVVGLLGCANGRGVAVTKVQDVSSLNFTKFDEKNNSGKPLKFDDKKIVLVSQTTQSSESFAEVAAAVKARFPDAEVIDTICRATKMRQTELNELASQCDAIVVIGSPKSANTQRLAQIAASLKKTIVADSDDDIRAGDFEDVDTVAVTAGASTPDFIIEAVVAKLKAM